VESIRQQHRNVSWLEVSPHPTEEERLAVLRAASAADVIIMATVNANLDQQEAELMQALIQLERRIIGIALANPYDLLAFPQLRTYVATYEYTIPALTAVVHTIFGATPPQGRLPVSLPGLYPLAHATADGYV
jgi:beta-N-acetylhexosaminidase